MDQTKRQRGNEEEQSEESPLLALLANGSSGRWSVTLDESTGGTEKWFLQVEGPSLHLCCEVDDPAILGRLANVLQAPSGNLDVFKVGKLDRIPLLIQWDDEYDDTVSIMVGPDSRPLARYWIHGSDVRDLADATRQAALDME